MSSLESIDDEMAKIAADEPVVEEPALEAEQNAGEAVEETVEGEQDTREDNYSVAEKEAMEKGWSPEGIPGKRHKSAEEFLAAGELIDKLEAVSSENKRYRETVEHMLKRFQDKEKLAYERAAQDILSQREAAVADGDQERFQRLDAQYNNIQKEMEAIPSTEQIEQERTAKMVADFETRNKTWYNADTLDNYKMMQDAIQEENRLASNFPNLPAEERLKAVEQTIRQRYASHDAFKNSRRESAVPAVTNNEQKRAIRKETKLTGDQEKFYQSIKSIDPKYTREQYLKDMEL